MTVSGKSASARGRVAALAAAALISACAAPANLDSAGDPLVVTETGASADAAGMNPQEATAVADMRARAVAGGDRPYPDASMAAQTVRLAARAEPLSVPDAAAIEAELATIARAEKSAIAPAELAGLKAREAELKRILAAAQAGTLR